MIKNKNGICILCSLLIVTILIFSGCSSEKSMVMDSASHEQTTSDELQKSDGGFGNQVKSENIQGRDKSQEQSSTIENNRKIIKSARVELETLEFDKTTNAIIQKIESIGGYIESSNISGGRLRDKESFQDRYASFILRVPEEFLDRFLLDINDIGNVILSETTGTDITGEYFDSEARLESLKIQEERLLEILKKAETVKDIIELERELSDVRYQIENFTGTLNKWDNMVSFATIQVSVYEVQEIKEPKPISLVDRMVDGFSSSIKGLIRFVKDFIVLIAALLPFIVLILVIFIIVRYILKKIKMKDKDNENQ